MQILKRVKPSSLKPWLNFLKSFFIAVSVSGLEILFKLKYISLLGTDRPFLISILAVVLSSYFGGLEAGLLSTILTVFATSYFFFQPPLSFVRDWNDITQLIIYSFQGFLISYLIAGVKKARDQESFQRKWFEFTMQSISEAIIATDNDGDITFLNKIAEQLTGWNLKEARCKPLNKVFKIKNESASSNLISPAEEIFQGNKFFSSKEAILISKDGKKLPIESNASPILNKEGQLLGIVLIFRDITEKRAFEKRKDDFISMTSHELRTPLSSIKAYTQLLQRLVSKTGDQKSQEIVNKSLAYINNLNAIIAELLDVSKMQSGKISLNFSPVNFDKIVKKTVENYQHLASNHKINLQGKTNTIVNLDQYRFEQALNNLLSNAIKYSPKKNLIDVNLKKSNGVVSVSVKDYGIGIDKNIQNQVFERFFRAPNVLKSYSGLGIGLYITRQIIKNHGGKITVKSLKNKGSTFSLILPYEKK